MDLILDFFIYIFGAEVDRRIDESKKSRIIRVLLRVAFVCFVIVAIFLIVGLTQTIWNKVP